MKRPVALNLIIAWSAVRMVWVVIMVLLNLRSMVWTRNVAPYGAVGISDGLLLSWAAVPMQMLAVFAGFRGGRIGEIAVEVLAAVAYLIISLGLWRLTNKVRLLSTALNVVECLLIIYYLLEVVPSLSVPWPELRVWGLSIGLVFLCAYSCSTFYLVRRSTRRFFARAN